MAKIKFLANYWTKEVVIQILFFQLPAIEVLCKLPSSKLGGKVSPINVLVLCPTRELASQVAAEAKKLLKYHPSFGAQVVIGGTRVTQEQRNMQTNRCQVKFSTSDPPLCICILVY